MTPFRVLITGSRAWDDWAFVWTKLNELGREYGSRLAIVHGACPTGADHWADTWQQSHASVPIERYPAPWQTLGKSAGQIRNKAMVDTRPDLVLAFIRNNSPGATGCARMATETGIPVRYYIYELTTGVQTAPPPSVTPLDPRPIPQRAGLGPAECVTCGAPCFAAPGIERPHCDPCRRARVELLDAESWISRLAARPGQLGLSHHAAVERHVRHEEPATVPVKIRIVERARDVTSLLPSAGEASIPLAARRLARTAADYGRRVRCTFALAHDMTKDKDIHSLCVRLWTSEGQRFGYASYIDGRFSSAVIWQPEQGGPRLARGVDEFAHLALGQAWTPPAPAIVGPCYACHRQVRWTKDAKPYKHRAEDGAPCWAGQEPSLQSS